MGGNQVEKAKLFQFWNTERAPDEVEVLMKTWADDASFEYHRFTTEMADAFIEADFDSRTLAAYRQCGVPAMQADFFRYCALYKHGGVYVDADTQNAGGLSDYLNDLPGDILIQRLPKRVLPNSFMFFRNPGSPLLSKVIEVAIANIERRISNSVWLVTGPGIQSQLYFSGGNIDLFQNISIRPMEEISKIVRFHNDLAYKKSDLDWRRFLKEDVSIYRD